MTDPGSTGGELPEPTVISEDDAWPGGISDGLTLPCSDCGVVPLFDYQVEAEFWHQWVPELPARLGVVCLPCLDLRCAGAGLAEAICFVQWTGTGHTVELRPSERFIHGRNQRAALDHPGEPRIVDEEVADTTASVFGLPGESGRELSSPDEKKSTTTTSESGHGENDGDDWTPEMLAP